MTCRVITGDALARLQELPGESVHCCATSPPYWGLRDYGVEGQLGLENTPEEYVDKCVRIFREVRRVLRRDGTLWLNMGDCYATGGGKVGECPGGGDQGDRWRGYRGTRQSGKHSYIADAMGPVQQPPGLKPKDLVGMPWMLAFALRADGWYLRRDIIWSKKNPMPESVTDRPATSHEYVFLLAREEQYFYDAEAVKEPVAGTAHGRGAGVNPKAKAAGKNSRMFQDRDPAHPSARKSRQNESYSAAISRRTPAFWESSGGVAVGSRNRRSVWTMATEPCREANFATFPRKLIEPCILAGTSERGCCSDCGAPLERVMDKPFVGDWNPRSQDDPRVARTTIGKSGTKYYQQAEQDAGRRLAGNRDRLRELTGKHDDYFPPAITLGWETTCNCFKLPLFPRQLTTVPCTVLDPFAGAGTTGLVAEKLGRDSILIELNPEYVEIIQRRVHGAQPRAAVPQTASAEVLEARA